MSAECVHERVCVYVFTCELISGGTWVRCYRRLAIRGDCSYSNFRSRYRKLNQFGLEIYCDIIMQIYYYAKIYLKHATHSIPGNQISPYTLWIWLFRLCSTSFLWRNCIPSQCFCIHPFSFETASLSSYGRLSECRANAVQLFSSILARPHIYHCAEMHDRLVVRARNFA